MVLRGPVVESPGQVNLRMEGRNHVFKSRSLSKWKVHKMGRQVTMLGFCFCHIIVLRPWALHLPPLGLSFLIYEMGVKEVDDQIISRSQVLKLYVSTCVLYYCFLCFIMFCIKLLAGLRCYQWKQRKGILFMLQLEVGEGAGRVRHPQRGGQESETAQRSFLLEEFSHVL